MQGFWYKAWLLIFENDIKGSEIPPKDTCTYRWDLIIASFVLLITLPVTIYRIIYLWVIESFDIDAPTIPGLLGHMLPTLFFILSTVVGIAFADDLQLVETYKWYFVIYGAILIILFGIVITIGISIVEWAQNKMMSIKFNKSESTKPPGTMKILYRGWKDKHCSHIDWEE